jgi:hypothetical protein
MSPTAVMPPERGPLPYQDQAFSAARTVITAVAAYGAGRGWLGQDTVALIGTLAPILIPLVWGMLGHTEAAKLKAVEELPGVTKILVHPDVAPDTALMAAAVDTSRPKVELAKV